MVLTAQLVEQFAKYGGYIGILTGILIAASLTAVMFLWKKLDQIEKDNTKKFEKLREEKDKSQIEHTKELKGVLELMNKDRFDDSRDYNKEIQRITEDANQTIRGLSYAMDQLKISLMNENRDMKEATKITNDKIKEIHSMLTQLEMNLQNTLNH
jgi:uncharacterized protein (DUF3084 family)